MTKYYEVVRDSKIIGIVWKDSYGWCCEISKTGNSYDCIDTKQQAIDVVLED